jgi:hypothetical protein
LFFSVLSINFLLWAYFWLSFFAASAPRSQVLREDCDCVPQNVVLWRTAGIEGSLAPHRILQLANYPSRLLAYTVVNHAVRQHPSWREAEFAGTSAGGFTLLTTMLLSFAQWYLLARIAMLFALRLSRAHPTLPRPE